MGTFYFVSATILFRKWLPGAGSRGGDHTELALQPGTGTCSNRDCRVQSGVSILHCRPFHLTATVPLNKNLHLFLLINVKKIFSSHIVCKYLFSAPSRIPHVPESGHSWGLELQNFCKPWLTGGSYLWRTGIFIGVMCAEFCTDWPPPLGRDLHARWIEDRICKWQTWPQSPWQKSHTCSPINFLPSSIKIRKPLMKT